MEINTSGYKKTQELGKIFAQEILRKGPQSGAVVLALAGDLGGGKTTFTQGFAKTLGVKEKITSPTFVIFKKFPLKKRRFSELPGTPVFDNFYHFDCYRLSGPKDILDMGFKEILSSPGNVVVLEWAERVKDILPQGTIWLKFDFLSQNKRKIVLSEFDKK
ncbi:MAG: tRNA (adenosine(37)-N6)-threonylcarbamoyltransferase complex ATPase subunit type 1 TsaE [Candidatus Paceibacterota bacterium]|jgi:tRNA threonylcarbamoyladenosine biosynthesis protein TsaE